MLPLSDPQHLDGTNIYRIFFAEQTRNGTYELRVEPDMRDPAGNRLDQDRDGIVGEGSEGDTLGDDVFVGLIEVQIPQDETGPYVQGHAPVLSYDPVDAVVIGFSEPIGFDPEGGGSAFGFQHVLMTNAEGMNVPIVGIIQQTPHILQFGFAEQNAPGTYDFIISHLVTDRAGNEMDQNRNGAPGEALVDDYHGSFEILAGIPDLQGPYVIALTPRSAAESFERLDLTFSEPVDGATLSAVDVEILDPHGNEVGVTAITPEPSNRFRLEFPVQTRQGDYALSVGPAIADVLGNLMDQDLDGTGGESSEDVYAATIQLTGIPDVTITNFNAPLVGDAGGTIPITYTVVNLGPGLLLNATWTDRFIISSDQVFGNGDDEQLAAITKTDTLPAGEGYTLDFSVPIPTTGNGSFTLFAVTDADGAIREVNEANNVLQRPIAIRKHDLGVFPADISFAPPGTPVGAPRLSCRQLCATSAGST